MIQTQDLKATIERKDSNHIKHAFWVFFGGLCIQKFRCLQNETETMCFPVV